MGLYVSPYHLQMAHYYFFCMAVSSFTSAMLFYFEPLYSYIFLALYIIHSGISWHIAWFLNQRLEEIYIINSPRYALSHFILTVWSSVLSIMLWYIFRLEYNAVINSLFMINFFLIFFAMTWYLLSRLGAVKKLFEWYDTRKAKMLSDMVLRLREQTGKKLVRDEDITDYNYGSDQKIDRLLFNVKGLRHARDKEGLFLAIRDLELEIWRIKIKELEKRTEELGEGKEMSKRELVKVYSKLIDSYKKKRMEYELYFFKKFGK